MIIAAWIFTGLCLMIGAFQIALALGAPLADYTLGGRFTGVLPSSLRLAALFQCGLIILFALVILSKAGMALPSWQPFSGVASWAITGFFLLGTPLNFSSKSKKERWVMGPANLLALVTTFLVARG